MIVLIVCLSQYKKGCIAPPWNILIIVVRYFFPTFENDGLLCGLPDDDDEEEYDDITVFGSYDGINCEIHGFNHSHCGKSGNYSNWNYNVETEHDDSNNICNEDNNGGSVVGHDKQSDINCGEQFVVHGGDGQQHDKNNENDIKNEPNNDTDFPAVLVNNGNGDNEKQEDDKCVSNEADDDHDRNVGHDAKNDFNKDNNLSQALIVNVAGDEDHGDDGDIQNTTVSEASGSQKTVDDTDSCDNQEDQSECEIDSV